MEEQASNVPQNLHWAHWRVIDPVGMFLHNAGYLNFRRRLLLTISKDYTLCIHRGCMEEFKKLDFFRMLGADTMLTPVEDKQGALKEGACAFLCCCQQQAKAAMAQLGTQLRPSTEDNEKVHGVHGIGADASTAADTAGSGGAESAD